MKDQELTGLLAVVGLFIVCPIALALMLASSKLGAASIPIWMSVAGAAWLILKGPVGDAIGARLRGGPAQGELSDDALAELEELRTRLAELEERQDFSERLLARTQEERPLKGGEHV